MSVAFRRESDEEHKEPRFEIPIPVGPNLVTPSGLAQIEARVEELEGLVATEDDETRLAEAKRDLRYWRTRLATAQVAPPPPEGKAAIGSQARFLHRGKAKEMRIVGDDEADPANGLISFSSPLGRALIGAEVGDLIDFGGEVEALEVIELS
nr:GreA/GreB family elongation factor [uncultured Sphingosinicella sp.]